MTPELKPCKFRKKPVIIEAEQFTGSLFIRGVCICGGIAAHLHTIHAGQVVELSIGDWIIPEPDGEHFYPCKPDIFEKTYEPESTRPIEDKLRGELEAMTLSRDFFKRLLEELRAEIDRKADSIASREGEV